MQGRDHDFVAKAVAIMEVELHPPADGRVPSGRFCADEKTGIGVRAPAALGHPAGPGQPAQREFEYVRHGTAAVLAAYGALTGTVVTLVRPRHRAREFLELPRLLDGLVPRLSLIHI